MCGLISVFFFFFNSGPLIHMSVFVPVPCCFDYCSFIALSRRVMPPDVFLLLMITLAVLHLLWFYINFRIICSSSVKNVMGNLIEITLNL